MKIYRTSKNFEPARARAFALLAMLASLVVILIVFSGVMFWVSTNSKQMKRNQQFTASEAAAEGASEVIFAQMDRDYLYGHLNSLTNYEDLEPLMSNWPVQYTFDRNIVLGPQSVQLQSLGSQYAGLLGEPQNATITVTANPASQLYNVPATVNQTYVFAKVPAFQFAIFYNINLEIDPGDTMPIAGAVFSNGSIWSGNANVTYSSTVEAAGQVYTTGTDPFMSGKTDSGTPQANFLYPGPPPQPESDVDPLLLPIGANTGTNDTSTNVQAIIEVPPASVAAPQTVAYQETNLVYDFNQASMIVSNWYWGTNGVAHQSNNFTVYLQDSVTAPSSLPGNLNWLQLTNDFYIVTNITTHKSFPTNYVPNFQFTNNDFSIRWVDSSGTNHVFYAGFSFLTNVTFYDYREGSTVQAVQIDVGALGAWITNSGVNGGSNWNQALCQDTGHGVCSIFVNNTVPPIGQQQLPAVRVTDGALLPSSTCTVGGQTYFTSGLSVATPQPLYVWGDYNVQTNGGSVMLASHNTANTYPAAFLADAVTILSDNWSDSVTSKSPNAKSTTINAACLEGIVPSSGSDYSGGVENFLRLLENWSGSTLTYNGSILVMFDSQFATNIWQAPNGASSYYYVPTRDWGFDTNYLTIQGLPALTPYFRAVIRNSWSGY